MCSNDFEASHELAQNCELKRFQGYLYQKGSASEPKNTVSILYSKKSIRKRDHRWAKHFSIWAHVKRKTINCIL